MLITILLVAVSGIYFGIKSKKELKEECSTYTRDNESLNKCATCGNGICEEFENCVPTEKNCDYSKDPFQCVFTEDCGGLYCEEDCVEIELG